MQSVELVDTFCDSTYMKPARTIGIVNGGGDAPGLKAVIRAVVRSATYGHGKRVIRIRNGFDGLIWPEDAKELTEESVSGILPRGGIPSLCMENARRLGVDAMIVTGGDGTQHIARDFFTKSVNVVGAPETIDNDLDATEVTFWF